MTNVLNNTIRILDNKDGTVCLFMWHPYDAFYKKTRDNNKPFINWIRDRFPHVMNEFRSVPRYWQKSFYDKNVCYEMYPDQHFCSYNIRKKDLILLKLSWSFKELQLHSRTRKNIPIKIENFFQLGYYNVPTQKCRERFEKSNYKSKLLRV